MQAQLFADGTIPDCSTADWYATRDRARHVDDPTHRPRLELAALMVLRAIKKNPQWRSVVDLGAGDGGLLSLLKESAAGQWIDAWGYDLQPSNIAGAKERGVTVLLNDVVNDFLVWGDIAVCTEVLEHLVDPVSLLRRIAEHCHVLVASSPCTETADSHYEHHLWAWDVDGYANLMRLVGFDVVRHETVGDFQVVLCVR